MACRLDLDDLTGTTARGLHMATMGGVWQALVYGFAGLRPGPDALHLDPRLPESWNGLEVRLLFHGCRLRISLDHDAVRVRSSGPLQLAIADSGPHGVAAGETRFDWREDTWERSPS
jgi:trehalose/maltose hydrolase-like predicted phosphorylase